MSYVDTLKEHLRITILRLLAEAPSYTMNDSIITDAVGDYGFNPSRDNVRTQISWLQEQDLVTTQCTNGCCVVRLTESGSDVARGARTVPGVKRPNAGEL